MTEVRLRPVRADVSVIWLTQNFRIGHPPATNYQRCLKRMRSGLRDIESEDQLLRIYPPKMQ